MMEDIELKQLWQSYNQKLEENLQINKKNTEEISKMKAQTFVASMKPIKIFTMLVGVLWVVLVDTVVINLVVHAFSQTSIFFLGSMGLQSLLTKIAIGIYLYQYILIHQVDISEPILKTQDRLARLQTSTLWVTRILMLQLPLWTTFYWSMGIFAGGNIWLIGLQTVITIAFGYVAIWLFMNIKKENKNKKWFQLIFKGREWTPILQAMEVLEQIEDLKTDNA